MGNGDEALAQLLEEPPSHSNLLLAGSVGKGHQECHMFLQTGQMISPNHSAEQNKEACKVADLSRRNNKNWLKRWKFLVTIEFAENNEDSISDKVPKPGQSLHSPQRLAVCQYNTRWLHFHQQRASCHCTVPCIQLIVPIDWNQTCQAVLCQSTQPPGQGAEQCCSLQQGEPGR